MQEHQLLQGCQRYASMQEHQLLLYSIGATEWIPLNESVEIVHLS